MRKNGLKFVSILAVILCAICIGVTSYAHSGRTDASGGHRDNKNKSGLGSYHYHCGGYPAHLHKNGVCPYASSSSSKKTSSSSSSKSSTSTKARSSTSSNSSSSKSSNKSANTSSKSTSTGKNSNTTSTKQSNISAKSVEISGNTTMKVGEDVKLIATVTPINATNCNITWKSSDESIAEVDQKGNVTAKKAGTVNISASTASGIKDEVKITIESMQNGVNSISEVSTSSLIASTTSNNLQENNANNSETKNEEETSAVGAVIVIALIGAGVAFIYNKSKKNNTKN